MGYTNVYYRHSGVIGTMGPLLILILGTISAAISGFIYSYAIYYIPLIYVNFCLTIFFGFFMGFIIGTSAFWGKIRNETFLFAAGFIFGLIAVYFSYVGYFYALSKQKILIFNISLLLKNSKFIALKGMWNMFGWTPKGWALYSIWFIEALIVVFISGFTSLGIIAGVPFCERCNCWIEEKYSINNLDVIKNNSELKKDLENSDFTLLENLEKIEEELPVSTEIEILHCKQCKDIFLLTVKTMVKKVNEDGEEEISEDFIIENLIIDKESAENLLDNWK